MLEFSFGSIDPVSFAVAYLESVADNKGTRRQSAPPPGAIESTNSR